MTRKDALYLALIGGGVLTVGGVIYFATRPASSSSPQPLTPSPAPSSSFAPTTTPPPSSPSFTPPPAYTPPPASSTPTPATQYPPSWNAFFPVVAGHRYKVTLTSSVPLNWFSIINPSAAPGGFINVLGSGVPTAYSYSYTLDATRTHQVQGVMFLLGVTAYVAVSVVDLGGAP